MDRFTDGATDSLQFSPDSSTSLVWPTTSHDPLQITPHRARRSYDPGNGEITTIAQIESRLKARYDARQACIPECEKGRCWTWITLPAASKGAPDNEIERQRILFEQSLRSQKPEMPEYKAKAYFRAGGPKVNIEQMRKHCDDVAEAVTSGCQEALNNARQENKPLDFQHALLVNSRKWLSTHFIRAQATGVFTALARACNPVPLHVVVGTYEWIDEYLSVKYDLSMEEVDDFIESVVDLNEEGSEDRTA